VPVSRIVLPVRAAAGACTVTCCVAACTRVAPPNVAEHSAAATGRDGPPPCDEGDVDRRLAALASFLAWGVPATPGASAGTPRNGRGA
jgi:hypothetical protein